MRPLPDAVEARLRELPRGLFQHVERVREITRDLAAVHGLDVERSDLAAAAHDLARAYRGDELLESASAYGIPVRPIDRASPVLLHGPVGAAWLQREARIADEEVLEAVRSHTSGSPGMGPIARVVFLADKLDPSKAQRYPFQDSVYAISRQDLDRALLRFLDLQLVGFLERGFVIDPSSVALRNDLLLASRVSPPEYVSSSAPPS